MKIKTWLYRRFNVDEDGRALLDFHLSERRKLTGDVRDHYAIQNEVFHSNKKLMFVWALLIALMDEPGKFLFVIALPVVMGLMFVFHQLFLE